MYNVTTLTFCFEAACEDIDSKEFKMVAFPKFSNVAAALDASWKHNDPDTSTVLKMVRFVRVYHVAMTTWRPVFTPIRSQCRKRLWSTHYGEYREHGVILCPPVIRNMNTFVIWMLGIW